MDCYTNPYNQGIPDRREQLAPTYIPSKSCPNKRGDEDARDPSYATVTEAYGVPLSDKPVDMPSTKLNGKR